MGVRRVRLTEPIRRNQGYVVIAIDARGELKAAEGRRAERNEPPPLGRRKEFYEFNDCRHWCVLGLVCFAACFGGFCDRYPPQPGSANSARCRSHHPASGPAAPSNPDEAPCPDVASRARTGPADDAGGSLGAHGSLEARSSRGAGGSLGAHGSPAEGSPRRAAVSRGTAARAGSYGPYWTAATGGIPGGRALSCRYA